MREGRWLVIVVVIGIAALAITTASAQGGEGDPKRGGELFITYCAMCHGEAGTGRVGASLDSFPGIRVDATLEQVIAQGIEGSTMPAWGEPFGGPLGEQDITDIAAYVIAVLGGTEPVVPVPPYQPPEIPALPDVAGDPTEGAVVFQANCIACHGEQAQGGFGWPLAKSWPGNQPAVYLRQVISEGIDGTVMPAWAQENGGPLSEEEIDSTAAYILSLSPVSAPPSSPSSVEGPLGRNVSLAILGGLALVVILGLAMYYRRAG